MDLGGFVLFLIMWAVVGVVLYFVLGLLPDPMRSLIAGIIGLVVSLILMGRGRVNWNIR